ncbi:MAG: hypothetical protein WAW75_09155 [Gallionella sp.]
MIILFVYLAVLITWVFYLAVMNLSENREEISWPVKVLFAWPVVLIGYIADICLAAIISVPAFLVAADIPKEFLFTSKMNRWQSMSGGILHRTARWFCREMLNKFAPNNIHCWRS